MSFQVGQEVWWSAEDDEHWKLGLIEEVKEDVAALLSDARSKGLKSRKGKNKKDFAVVPLKELAPANPPGMTNEDMTSLKFTNEPAILHNLAERSFNNFPYTFLGTVLITVNPIKDVGDPKKLLGSTKAMNKPHPYGIAERAFQQMTFASRLLNRGGEGINLAEYQPDQSVVISGESGSGKTESSKRVLRHLVARCASQASKSSANPEVSTLEQALLDANPVLEAFGNAMTLSNHNSSRFGKLTKVFFQNEKLNRAKIDTYLLERSRVTSHEAGERNFHIFYRLLSGLSESELAEMGLQVRGEQRWQAFEILKTENIAQWVIDADPKSFADLKRGLKSLGFSDAEELQLFRTCAALLHIGNLQFEPSGQATDARVNIIEASDPADSRTTTEWAADLLQIPAEELRSLLCERTIIAAGEAMQVHLKEEEAVHARDGLLRAIYSSLFDWIISRANAHFGTGPTLQRQDSISHVQPGIIDDSRPDPSIGVLDIFGFECFKRNGLEQLLINFANEALQKTFSEQVLIAERNLFKSEGLWVDDDEMDIEGALEDFHGGCAELLQGKKGLLKTVEDQTTIPQPSDEKLLAALHKDFDKHSHYVKPHPRFIKFNFTIRHFAGDVQYNVEGFVTKNVDRVPQQVLQALSKSEDTWIVSKLFDGNDDCDQIVGNANKKRKRGLCLKFSHEMKRLIKNLESTNCSFIRCIKPNPSLQRGTKRDWFDNIYVQHQLRHLSIPQTAQVLSAGGLPTRIGYADIFTTYQHALPKEVLERWASVPGRSEDFGAFTRALFFALEVDSEMYRFGITKVFFKKGALSVVEGIFAKGAAMNEAETAHVGKRFSLFHARILWRRCLAKVITANTFLKLLKRAQMRAEAADVIRRFLSCIAQRRVFLACKAIAISIQTFRRGQLVRREWLPKIKAHRKRLAEERREAERLAEAERLKKEMQDAAQEKKQEEEVEEICSTPVPTPHTRFEFDTPLVAPAAVPNAANLTSLAISPSPRHRSTNSIILCATDALTPVGTGKVKELEEEIRSLRHNLAELQGGQQAMLRMMEESQRRERLILEEHFRLLHHLEKKTSGLSKPGFQPPSDNTPKRIKQDSHWTWCLFGRCYNNATD